MKSTGKIEIKTPPAGRLKQKILSQAIAKEDMKTIKQVLEKNPELVNVKDETGKTVLMIAAKNGNIDILQKIPKDVQINERDQEGKTALMYAAQAGHLKICKWLLFWKASYTIPDEKRKGVFEYAEENGPEFVSMLKNEIRQIKNQSAVREIKALRFGNHL